MSIITAKNENYLGNTLKAAAMSAFKVGQQNQVKLSSIPGIVSIFKYGKWTDYDFWVNGDSYSFLLAE